MIKKIGISTALALGLALSPTNAPADDFYAGKSLSFIVGYRAGGGYDTYTRAVARHIGRHIPGQPSAVVENKGGAGSLIAANYLYSRSAADGLAVGVFGGGLLTQQALEAKGVRFDGRKFNWVGSMAGGAPACAIMGFTGLKTLDDVLRSKRALKIGATGPGSTTDDLPKLMVGMMGPSSTSCAGLKALRESASPCSARSWTAPAGPGIPCGSRRVPCSTRRATKS